MMTRMKSFETAASRRRKNPIVWNVDGHDLHLVASLELADLADLIEALQSGDESDDNSIRVAAMKRKVLLEIVERFIQPDSRETFRSISGDLDIHLLNEMVVDLIQEYSGARNPTKPSSSSAGSDGDGRISTDGVQHEESMR